MKRAENRFALPSNRADHTFLRRTHIGFAFFIFTRIYASKCGVSGFSLPT